MQRYDYLKAIAPDADKTPQLGKKTIKQHHASDTPKPPDEAAPAPSGEGVRGPTNPADEVPSPASAPVAADLPSDYLDIPAFLRRQAD